MKEGWKKIELGKLAHFESGSRPKGGVGLLKDGVFSLGGEHIGKTGRINIDNPKYVLESYYDNNTNGHINDNDILLCKDGALSGKVALVHGEFKDCKAMINEHVFIIRTESLLQDFLFYYLFSPAGQQQLKLRVSGAAQGGINGTNLKTIPIPFPDNITQQQQIVSELDLLSAVIEKQKAQIDELNKLAQSIFYDMFGDPVTNEKGWVIFNIKDIIEVIGGYAFKSSEYTDRGVRLVQISNVWKDNLTWEDKTYVPLSIADSKNSFYLKPGDIVMALTRPIIKSLETVKVAMVNEKDTPCVLNQRVCKYEVNKKKVNSIWFFNFTKTVYFKEKINSFSSKGMQPNVSTKEIEKIEIPLPPLSLQQEFAAKIEAIEAMKAKVRQSLKESEQLFNSRMDYYFN